MEKFDKLTGVAAPLDMINVDTDKIIPKQHLKSVERGNLAEALFDELRYLDDGTENPDFILNKDSHRSSEILIAGENFGCGSSREHAPWAIRDFGIRCVIAPSFADIFFSNSFKNGMLLITLPREVLEPLMEKASRGANATFTVNLERQVIVDPDGEETAFEVDGFRRKCLLNGTDEIGLSLENIEDINTYETRRSSSLPWLE
ncbi:3-isopropylmalate dehydratase small subunit [Sneathiella chungangensis]|uniref:3-isopropylmalate dehydratase small subunit n=1 Tax=Sneathiella chungangensis TaxID=1418234 RepID=A0A845MKS9_9PROT|nr:3-isopropylmalate dehydratase small subunit [Sneathiella chungangensis]MZR24349.1 3-isopropylmalate dehydratase small subunit [Sneathiella chungangensis]